MEERVVGFFSDCHGANGGYEGPPELVFEGGLQLTCVTVGGQPCVQQGDDVFTCSPTGSSPGAPGTGAAHQPGTPRMTSSEQGEVVFSLQFGPDDALYHYKLGRVLGQGAYGGVLSLEPKYEGGLPMALKISTDSPHSMKESGKGFNAVTAKHFLESEARFMHNHAGQPGAHSVAAYIRRSRGGGEHTAFFMPRIEGIAAHSLMCRVLQLFPESCAETQDLYFPQGVKYPPKGGSLLLATLAIYKDEDEDEDELLQALLWRFKVFYSLTSGAIVHLHEQGMVHGDMNLGNIMLYGLTEELMDGVIGDFDSLTQARDAHNSALLIDAPFSMPAGQAMFVNELKPNVAGSWLWSPERLGRELSPEFHERIFKGMSSEQEKRACALEIFFTVNGLTARPVFDWYTYIYGCLHVQLGPQVLGSYEAVDFLLRLQEALDSLPDASTHKTVEFFLNRSLELMINAKLPDKVSSALLGMQGPDLSAVIPVVLIQTCIPILDQALREGVEAASTVSGSPFCVDQVGGRLFTAGGEGSAFSPPSGLSGGGAAASQGTLSPR